MTMSDERYAAVLRAREFLQSLLDPKKTPKVPKSVRSEAYRVLRHFPHGYEMKKVSERCPELFNEQLNLEESK